MSKRAFTRLLLPAAGAGILLLGCSSDDDGGSSNDSGAPASESITVTAKEFSLEVSSPAVAGSVEITYDNAGAIFHNLAIDGIDEEDFLLEANANNQAVGTVDLEAGEYVLYCAVTGHRTAGMEITLTVE